MNPPDGANLPGLVGLAVTLFAVTNADDLVLLALFFADRASSPWRVVAGQYLGFAAILAVSLAGALVSLVATPECVALLGLLPLCIGLKKLRELRAGGDDGEEATRARGGGVLAVAAVTFANGGDNLGVYLPVFAARRPWEVGLLVAVFLAMAAVWCGAARLLVGHRGAEATAARYGHVLLPVVLIGLGLWILADALPLFRAFAGR